MSADVRDLFLFGLAAGAPLALTLIVALLRGYTIDLHMTRDQKRQDREP
jgi:hypothetical protein